MHSKREWLTIRGPFGSGDTSRWDKTVRAGTDHITIQVSPQRLRTTPADFRKTLTLRESHGSSREDPRTQVSIVSVKCPIVSPILRGGGHRLRASTHNWTLHQGVESDEITGESINKSVHTVIGEVVVERKGGWGSTITEGISGGGNGSVVPPDPVGNGIGDLEIFRKGTGSDLVIVVGVTESTHSSRRGRVEDRGVGEIGDGIYEARC